MCKGGGGCGRQPIGFTKLFMLAFSSQYDPDVFEDVLKELLNINDELKEFSLLLDILETEVFIMWEFCEAVE